MRTLQTAGTDVRHPANVASNQRVGGSSPSGCKLPDAVPGPSSKKTTTRGVQKATTPAGFAPPHTILSPTLIVAAVRAARGVRG